MKTYSSWDIVLLWDSAASLVPVTADNDYAVPTKRWLLSVAETVKKGSLSYRPSWDCNAYAFNLKVITQKEHAKRNPSADGLAVGVCFYRPDNIRPLGHAINWSITKQGKLWFLEPQTAKEIKLTEQELHSVFFAYC